MPHSNPNFYDAIVSGISSSQNHWGTGSLTSSYVAHIAGIIYNAINTISTNLDAEGELLQSIVGGLFSTNPIIPSLDSNYTTVAAAISVLFEQQRVGLDPTSSGGAGPQGNQGWQGTGGGGGGTQGPQGRQGVQGSTGSGTQGPQGSTGSGTQGRQGPQGSTGSGFQGNQGAKGDQGDIGTQGAQGSTGSGFQGNQGFQGDLGTQGVQGTIGSGTQGAQGAQGDVGSGTQGFQGYIGAQGFQGSGGGGGGTQGPQGWQGDIGSGGPDEWATVWELDFSAQPDQTFATDGNYTIGGLTWNKVNSSGDATAMQIVNGVGLQITPTSSTDLGTSTWASPLISVSLDQLVPTGDVSTPLELWVYLASENAVASYDNTVMGFHARSGGITNRLIGIFRGIYGSNSAWLRWIENNYNAVDGLTNSQGLATKTHILQLTNGFSGNHVQTYMAPDYSGGWPSRDQLTTRGEGAIGSSILSTSTQLSGVNVFFSALRAGSGTAFQTTISRVRLMRRTGPAGTSGSTGVQGTQGTQGWQGSGSQGFQGFQGPSGSGGTIFVGLASALPDPAGFIDGTMYIPTDDTTQLIDISHHWNILIPGSAPVPTSVGDISGWTYESGITGAAVLQAHNSYTRMVSLLANPAPDYVDWLPPSPALNVGPGGIWTITMATKYIPSNTRYLDGNPYSSINIVLLDGSGNRFMFGPQDSPSGPLLLSAAACGFSGHTRNYYGGLSANNLHTTNYITWVRLRFDGVNYISEYSVDGANWNVSTAGGTNIFNWGGGAIVPVSWGVGTQYIPNSFGNWDIYQLDQTPTNG
jgi:hypothetical protein